MTHASLAPDAPMSIADIHPDDLVEALGRRPAAVTLWFFALTAMTLVFVSLLLLGVLARRDAIDASVGTVLTGYTVLVLGIGLFGFAFVLSVGRRNGLLAAVNDVEATATAASEASGLVIAPTVPPRAQLPAMWRPGIAPPSRTRRRAVVAAASSQRHHPPSSFLHAPTQVVRYPVRRSASQVEAPSTRRTIMASTTAPRARSAVRPTMPLGVAPAFRGPDRQRAHRGVAPVALQVRMADLRSAAWDRPQRPTLTDRLLGRGTHRTIVPPSLIVPPSPMPPARPSPRPVQAVRPG